MKQNDTNMQLELFRDPTAPGTDEKPLASAAQNLQPVSPLSQEKKNAVLAGPNTPPDQETKLNVDNYDPSWNDDDFNDRIEAKEFTVYEWLEEINDAFKINSVNTLLLAQSALQYFPTDPMILSHAAYAAIHQERPDFCLLYIKRMKKRFIIEKSMHLCEAIAMAQQGKFHSAYSLLRECGELILPQVPLNQNIPLKFDRKIINRWIRTIKAENEVDPRLNKTRKVKQHQAQPAQPANSRHDGSGQAESVQMPFEIPPLTRHPCAIPVAINLPSKEEFDFIKQFTGDSFDLFKLRGEIAHLSLQKGFDEIICLEQIQHINYYWYQVETARKALKQFRGRVLLADEVGLGKTIEAGLILKEYILRKMVRRFLILTPSSLVGQWEEEMRVKFGIECLTSYNTLVKDDPESFWKNEHVIASIALARRQNHYDILAGQNFDMVIVDEAHHLKNRKTRNWKLVDSLKTRFLLLLSATPVQNNLIELYNILTLLKPGIFKTEKDFKSAYMTAGNPRLPANSDRLRQLMRDVMIRNTRSLVDIHLPPRHAATIRVEPTAVEIECYSLINRLIRDEHEADPVRHRLAHIHLLAAAGSAPVTAARAIERHAANSSLKEWAALLDRYAGIKRCSKSAALIDLIRQNPGEKKIIFIRFRDTIDYLSSLLRERGYPFERFDGQMSGIEKDEAIERFRESVPILLCTESGGEGRNMQFCNTIINYDLPWNPQAIEQRIGRIHRIGQTRDVFVFNLALKNTLEDHMLRILDEKINMFELVVGEIQSILGELEDDQDFESMIFSAWIAATGENSADAFSELGEKLIRAREQYNEANALDTALFGEEFEAV